MRKTEKVTKLKRNEKGITLIALVITIIVLLILAGVAISMLSGENGILTQAAKAKTEHEVEAKTEEAILNSTAVQMEIAAKGLKNVRCSNGFVTGTNIEQLTTLGYSIDPNEAGKITTGVKVLKDGKQVATVVVYGDVNGDGLSDAIDSVAINRAIKGMDQLEDYEKIAGDVNFDGCLNIEDVVIISYVPTKGLIIPKNKEAQNPNKIIVESTEVYYGKQIEKIGINNKIINKEWIEENSDIYYKLYINANTLTVEECMSKNTDTFIIDIQRGNEVVETGNIQNGDKLILTKKYKSGEEYYNIVDRVQRGEFVISE